MENNIPKNKAEIKIVNRKHGRVLFWNGHQFYKHRIYKSKSSIWTCSQKQKLKCNGSVTIDVPPAPTPRGKGAAPQPPTKIVADPRVELIRPNTIDRLVPYQPCAYCVEDYIMNQVFETPAVPADDEYVQSMFRLEDVNTKFGIYTLTIPAKRHPIKTKAE